MPVVLLVLVLGAATSVAGLVLIASGLVMRDGSFISEVLTPGAIAVVGGLLLIGLGFVVRELRRIERGLATRPTPRVARAEEAAAPQASETAMAVVPPPMPTTEPQVAAAPAAVAEVPVEDASVERLRAKFPTIPRVENGRLSEAADVSLALREAAGVGEGVAEVRSVANAGRLTNGVAASARIVTRTDAKPRPPMAPAKAKVSVFNTFWPAPPRRDGQANPARTTAPPPPPIVQEAASQPGPVPAPPPLTEAPPAVAPVSVLKSGVVEGMAYTLYSDGSIEAQLPQGTLRFGSISALRSHIESTG
jgi:hypothetical protein